MKNSLQKARAFENKYLPRVEGTDILPHFHMTAGVGWINDPNGFSLYKGEYHLFFQYYPYDVKWGPMHWGHVKTKDFVRPGARHALRQGRLFLRRRYRAA